MLAYAVVLARQLAPGRPHLAAAGADPAHRVPVADAGLRPQVHLAADCHRRGVCVCVRPLERTRVIWPADASEVMLSPAHGLQPCDPKAIARVDDPMVLLPCPMRR